MREYYESLELSDEEQKYLQVKKLLKLIVKPIGTGLYAFSIFFSVILITKAVIYFLNPPTIFNLNIYDILFSFLGFLIGFGIEFILILKSFYITK